VHLNLPHKAIEVDIKMSNNGNTKKRRVGGDGARVSIDGGGESNSASELAAIKSMMQELVQQNRTQTNMINNMQGKINDIQEEITQLSKKCMSQNRTQTSMMQNMQGDITRLTNRCDRMERDNKRSVLNMNSRFDVVEDKLKYHDILLQNQKWKYLVPRPPDEYWSRTDVDDEEVEDFLNQIKKCTEEMRYGNGDGDIELDAQVLYHEELLPHWKEFANALEQYSFYLNHSVNKRDDSKLRLGDVDLPEDVINLLSQALKSTHFHRIVLTNNNLGQRGWDFALNSLENNTIMKELCLEDNPINSMKDIERLCQIVRRHPSLRILTLCNCKGVDINGYEMLKIIMNAGKRKLELIDLSNNSISTGGSVFISDFLATNPKKMESLFLEGNQLDDNDAIGIAGALKQNTNLRFLDLTNNINITRTGWMALRKTEFDDTSLNAASDCNHSCNIKYPSDEEDENNMIVGLDTSEMNGDRNCNNAFHPHFVRQKKIYSILSSRNRDCSNVEHFDNVPVELLPDMLYTIKEYSNYPDGDNNMSISKVRGHVSPLSLVYEVCRHWEESLAAFEALSS